MAPADDLKPRLSVILPAMRGIESVSPAIRSWEAQTSRDQIELIVISPDDGESPAGGWIRFLRGDPPMLHVLRADAVQMARGDWVCFAEDHCLPDRNFVESILSRLGDEWDAVGPSLRPGVRGAIPEGSFLLGYGQWLLPNAQAAKVLPGHNVVVRRSVLLDLGLDLERHLIWGMFLMRDLQRAGKRFFVDDRTVMTHFDERRFPRSLEIFFSVGEGCGAMRTRQSSVPARILFALTLPLIAARHFARAAIQYGRAGRRAGLSPFSVGASAIFAVAWAAGECSGALKGLDRVRGNLWEAESKPLARLQVRSTTG